MIKLLQQHRKSVSPVIAVVLLIALTVAAGAIIWTIVLPLLQPREQITLTEYITQDLNASNVVHIKVVLESTSAGTINSVTLELTNGTSVSYDSATSTTTVTQGTSTYDFYFQGITAAGSGKVIINWTPEGGSSTTSSFDVTFS